MKTIVEVLTRLNSGENYFVKVDNYQNIGNKVVDNFNVFEQSAINVPTPFNLVGNDSRLNLSVDNKIYGKVKINPRQAKKVGLPNEIKTSMMYKRRTVIRDGELNIAKMEVIVDLPTYMDLRKNNIPFVEKDNTTSHPGNYIEIDFSNMPVAVPIATYTLDDILENATRINTLTAKQKVLNARRNQVKVKEDIVLIPGFSQEQTDVLREHGLDSNLVYVGVDVEVQKAAETYEAEVIQFKVKGSTMSSYNTMLKRVKNGDKLNALDTVQHEYDIELTERIKQFGLTTDEQLFDYYSKELNKVKGELFKLRLTNTMIKLSFMTSPLKEVAFDSEGDFQYKGLLTISYSTEKFTK